MHLLPEVDCGPKAWTVLKELHAPTSVVATLMLRGSCPRRAPGEPVQPVLDKMRDLYAKLATAGITYPEQTKGRGFGGAGRGTKKDDDSNDQQGGTGWGRGAKSGRGGKSGAGGKMKGSCWYCEKEGHPWFLCYKKPDGWTPQNRHQDGGARRNQKNGANMVADSFDNNRNGGAEKKKERTAGQFFHIGEQGEQGDASAKVGAELHPLDYWVLDTGAAWTMTPRKDLLDDVRAAPINEVCSASGHALKVAGAGRAAFKGADGKPVVLHDVLLVPDLKANLISLRKLAKAGVSTSTDGARTYKGQLGNRVLWDLHQVGNSMWPHSVRHATVARNRVLTKVGNESWVPLERWLGRKPPVDMPRVFSCMAVAHVPKKYRSKLGASAIWCVHLGLAAESKGWLLWEPSKGVLFDSRDVKFVEGMVYAGWKKQPETKVSQQMEQITMQLDLTPSVWEDGEEAAAEGGDGEKVQEAPGGGDDVETSGSTKETAGSEGGEQQQGKAKGEKLVLFLVYVDDILLFSSSMKEIQNVQQQLMKNFKCKTLGEVKYYLGMHVERDLDHRWLKLHQEKFIKELGEKYGIENERKVATPLPAEFKLVKAAEDEGVEAEEQQQFQSLVGSLLYAAVHTRPDISFSVGQLARVVQNPSEEQVDAAERVVKYLNSHPSIGVQYSASAHVKQKGVEVLKDKREWLGEGKLFLTCFTDATWASEKDDSSSVGGYICVVDGTLIC
ncbi:unnamed protein product [Closterium sp. NIES-53]